MRYYRKGVAMFLVLIIVLAMLTACSDDSQGSGTSSEGAGTSGQANEAQKPVSEEPYELTFLTPGDMATKPLQPNDRIIAEINKRLGIKLQVNAVPQGNWDKINVAMASGDLPDVVVGQYPSAAVSQWIKDGILIPLNDYLKFMPTVKKKLEDKLAWTAVEGKYYGYVFIEERANGNMVYRGDWLEKLGLKAPQTLDDFYNTLKAFVTQDPDGNGKADTIGYTSQKPIGNFDFVFYAYGKPYADWALDNSGNVIPNFEHPSFKEGMVYLKRLWDEKLIDSEFMLNDTLMMEEKYMQGRAGSMFTALFRNLNRIESGLQKAIPTGRLEFFDPPAGPNGKRGGAATPKSGMITGITKDSKNPEKAAKFIEFLLSQEGRDLLQLGIEGIHYTKQRDKIIYNEEERAKDGFNPNGWAHPLAWGHVVWPLTLMYLPDTEPQKERALQSVEVATRNMMPNLIPVTTDAEVEYGSVVNEIYNQYFMDMLTGKVDIDKGLAELSQKWRQQGGDQILKAVNEAYAKYKK